MTKLRTLKDIQEEFIDEHNNYIVDELRAEAIKWVKELESYDSKESLRIIMWIIKFFNLTEDDLK